MNCANCPHHLTPEVHGPVTMGSCGKCGGIWFDRSELEQYAASFAPEKASLNPEETLFRVFTAEGVRVCPACEEKTLQHVTYGVPEAFRCSQCEGVFVTKNEMKRYEIAVGKRKDYPGLFLDLLYVLTLPLILAAMVVPRDRRE